MKLNPLAVAIGGIVSSMVLATPTATYKGGRYYLWQDEVRQDKYYTQIHTATAAAVNLSFRCRCTIKIEHPFIYVSTTNDGVIDDTAKLTWTAPTQRSDGTILKPAEISHYVITETLPTGQTIQHVASDTNTLLLTGLTEGLHSFIIQAVDTNEVIGLPSEAASKQIIYP